MLRFPSPSLSWKWVDRSVKKKPRNEILTNQYINNSKGALIISSPWPTSRYHYERCSKTPLLGWFRCQSDLRQGILIKLGNTREEEAGNESETSVGRLVGRLVGRSVGRSVGRWETKHFFMEMASDMSLKSHLSRKDEYSAVKFKKRPLKKNIYFVFNVTFQVGCGMWLQIQIRNSYNTNNIFDV